MITSTNTTFGNIGDAVATLKLTVESALRGLDELRRVGLLQRTPCGTGMLFRRHQR
jgi:hypothetical protein